MAVIATEAVCLQLRIILKEREGMFEVARLQDMERFYYQDNTKLRVFALFVDVVDLRDYLEQRLREEALAFFWL